MSVSPDPEALRATIQADHDKGCLVCDMTDLRCSVAALLALLPSEPGTALVHHADGSYERVRLERWYPGMDPASIGAHVFRLRPLPAPVAPTGPQPTDGPDYHADHAAWRARHRAPAAPPEETT